jgi:AraC-like DNA-binding protein/mannose-6-phosphate isomerase-like protein (cupin superfamily)
VAIVKDQSPPHSITPPLQAEFRDFHLCNQIFVQHLDSSSSWIIRGLRWSPQAFTYCCPVESDHSQPVHEHDVFELGLVCQGKLLFKTPDHSVSVRPGEVYFMPPGMKHSWNSEKNPLTMAGFVFRVSALDHAGQAILDALKKRVGRGEYSLKNNRVYDQIHRTIWEAIHRVPHSPLLSEKLTTLFQHFVQEFLEQALPESVLGTRIAVSTLKPDTVAISKYQQIVDYVNRNIHQPLQLEDIAHHFNYSVRHVSRLFQKESGISLGLFILERKLRIAQRMLATTDYPVKTIAMELGYRDVGYFCRLFRTHLLGTPNSYRVQILAGRTILREGPSGHHSFRGNFHQPARVQNSVPPAAA